MPENFKSKWDQSPPAEKKISGGDSRHKNRTTLKKVGTAVGLGVLGAALALGGGESKKTPKTHQPEQGLPLKKDRFAPAGKEDLAAMRRMFTKPAQIDTPEIIEVNRATQTIIPQSLPVIEHNKKQVATTEEDAAQEDNIKEEDPQIRFLWDVANINPADILRNHLETLKQLPEEKGILSAINMRLRDPDDEKLLFDSLPKISDLNIVSEEDFSGFIQTIIETHPGMYLRKLSDPNIVDYLPQDAETIIDALTNNPSILVQAGLSAEERDPDPLTDPIRTAIESSGDTALINLYNIFTDPQHQDYAQYSAKEKMQIAALLPLMQNGSLTFDDAAELIQTDTIGYWQALTHAVKMSGNRTLIAQELERVARALINHGEPDDMLLKEVENRFSAQEITILTTHANQPTTPTEQAIFDRLSETVSQKLEAEIDRRP